MFYSNKSCLENAFIFALCLLPVANAAADDLPQKVDRLQAQITDANEKIAVLESDQQSMAGMISALQTRLKSSHQEISDLKNTVALKHKQLLATTPGAYRTANGHGR